MGEVGTMSDAIGQFAKAKYLNLETFRKTGVGVRTPVWFAQEPEPPSRVALAQEGMEERLPSLQADPLRSRAQEGPVFYVYTLPDSGKAKRIRNNPGVRVAPCDMRGNLGGAWLSAHARLCESAETAHGQDLLRRKYGWMKIVGDFFSRLRGRTQVVIAIHID
jgi:PPOX class probable F420-dependent enzyme